MMNMKGLSLTLSSALLASLLALSGTAVAQETSEVAPDSGVEAGVEGHNVPPKKPAEQTNSSSVDGSTNSTATQESEVANDDGVDALKARDSDSGAQEGDQTTYNDEELVEDDGVDTKEDRIDEEAP
ncbi:hypothetical protein R6258_10665 [Halomonas sp. HP20-15]|uniref:hypothetical protein n=1 Tax=Halomonas sp. HP20-15 TaxID=3085901 RepID=UPI0029814B64|nr:hypothetical protein [Halomonas sp. HP20-15]MDW5377377.1 hypothetical protein [Halomonas sp. HP20-15]